jgi:hypothetical protein
MSEDKRKPTQSPRPEKRDDRSQTREERTWHGNKAKETDQQVIKKLRRSTK